MKCVSPESAVFLKRVTLSLISKAIVNLMMVYLNDNATHAN